jgi:dTDP-4-amino-4,6-dideoxygalactose transaminase
LHLQKPLLNFQKYNIKNSKQIADRLICLPNSSFLKKDEINKISKNIMFNLR